MSTINGKSYQDPRNINLKGGATGTGLLRWNPPAAGGPQNWSSNPFSTNDYGLYINSSGNLVYSKLGTTTILGAGGGGGIPTWEQIFASDTTFNVAGTTWTIDNSTGNNDVLTLTNSGAGSGAVLQFNNAGTGHDVDGTSDTWSVTKTGAAAFLSVASATINGAGAGITIGDSGANVVTIGTNSNTITLAKATTFSSIFTGTTGIMTSTSNTVAGFILTNNTVTTMGAAASSLGMIVARSTSLTTGTAIRAQLAEGTVTTGKYFEAWDSVGVAPVWFIGAGGAQTIGGIAGSTVFTITTGDMVMSDGSLAITDADNAATFTVTNDTATTASVVVIAGSGTFTGSTTSSFVTITPSGLTSGTGLYFVAAALDSGKGMHLVANALTTGELLHLAHTTSVIADGGSMLRISSTSIDTGGATNGTLLDMSSTSQVAGSLVKLVAGAVTTGILVDISSTTGMTSGSLIRATTATAGAIATNGAISFTATGNYTVGAVGVGFFSIQAAATAAGTIASITGGALTTGVALYVADTTTGMTSGSLIRATSGTTGVVATSGVYSFLGTGAFTTGASTVGLFHVAGAATVSGTIMSILGGAQTTGIALNITDPSTGMTSGSLLRVISATTGAVATNGLVSLQASGAYTSTSNVGLLTLIANSTTAGTIQSIFGNGLTTGVALLVSGTGVYTGTGFVTITQSGATTGVVMQITTAGLTTGSAFSITSAALTTGNGILVTDSSADTGAHCAIFSKVTNTAATAATPLKTSNVAVLNSKFTKQHTMTDGTKTINLWMSQDNTDPNGTLSGTAGDVLFNGPSSKIYICTGTTNWSATS